VGKRLLARLMLAPVRLSLAKLVMLAMEKPSVALHRDSNAAR
jgi:hypothetical protein